MRGALRRGRENPRRRSPGAPELVAHFRLGKPQGNIGGTGGTAVDSGVSRGNPGSPSKREAATRALMRATV
jgi:hypothetical protein